MDLCHLDMLGLRVTLLVGLLGNARNDGGLPFPGEIETPQNT